MSACVTVCVALQTSDAPGASVAGVSGRHGPSTAPTPGSVTATPVTVASPVFVTVTEYVMTWPTVSYGPVEVTLLTTLIPGFWAIGTVAASLLGGARPESPIATLVYWPASMSAWVTRWTAVQTTEAPGASVAGIAGVQSMSPART